MAKYDNILGTVGNTPAVRVNKLAPAHVKLYVKVEAFNPMGSVKDRLALGIIEDAERRGVLRPGQTIVEATSGNTGIGLAMVCAQKGYPLVVTMAVHRAHHGLQRRGEDALVEADTPTDLAVGRLRLDVGGGGGVDTRAHRVLAVVDDLDAEAEVL